MEKIPNEHILFSDLDLELLGLKYCFWKVEIVVVAGVVG